MTTKESSTWTFEFIREMFEYRDGHMYRLKGRHWKDGRPVGAMGDQGYVRTSIDGKYIAVHRLVFFWHHGWWPEEVDHINHIRHDNRIENLRAATKRQNQENRSNVRGTTRSCRDGRWQTRIKVNGKYLWLGRYDTEAEAHAAYAAAKLVHHKLSVQ